MKLVIFTANSLRHKFLANTLAGVAEEALIISECKEPNESLAAEQEKARTLPEEHFLERYRAEEKFFRGHEYFHAPTLPLLYKEANAPFVYGVVKSFAPDMGIVFGSCILKEPLLSLIPAGRFVNLHLGVSPYYRGSATNFWPFVNNELVYVGSTILHIDPGVDTGDIIAHVFPRWEAGDTVHTAGCNVIRESVSALCFLVEAVKRGERLPRTPQWKVEHERYYRRADFTEESVAAYRRNMAAGMVEQFLQGPKFPPRYVPFKMNS